MFDVDDPLIVVYKSDFCFSLDLISFLLYFELVNLDVVRGLRDAQTVYVDTVDVKYFVNLSRPILEAFIFSGIAKANNERNTAV